ncbi:MAG: hypothetical protein Q9183_003418 [Haloplaca sp. 2 TL-2023]
MQNQMPIAGRLYDPESREQIEKVDKDWVPVRRRIANNNDRTVVIGDRTPHGSPLQPPQGETSRNTTAHSRREKASARQTAVLRCMHDGHWSLVPSCGLSSPALDTRAFKRHEEDTLGECRDVDDTNILQPGSRAGISRKGPPVVGTKENSKDSSRRSKVLNWTKADVSHARGKFQQGSERGGTATSPVRDGDSVDSSTSWIKERLPKDADCPSALSQPKYVTIVPRFTIDLALESTDARRPSRSTSLPAFLHRYSDARGRTAPAFPRTSSADPQTTTSGGTQVPPNLAVSARKHQQNASEEQQESDASQSEAHQPFVSDATSHSERTQTPVSDKMTITSADSSESWIKSSVASGVVMPHWPMGHNRAELARAKGSADVPKTDSANGQRSPETDEADAPQRGRSLVQIRKRDYDKQETAERILDSPNISPTETSLLAHDRRQKTAQNMIEWLQPDPKPEPGSRAQSKPQPKLGHCSPSRSPLRRDDSATRTSRVDVRSPSLESEIILPRGYGMRADWRWLSQTDALPGYWATSWWSNVKKERCIGIISVVLENLGRLHDKRCIHYYTHQQDWAPVLDWAQKGYSTWPSYARNARGGVVVEGSYVGVIFPGFTKLLPRIVLVKDHAFQTQFRPPEGKQWDELRLAEIMLLDSWLSMAGRTPEIAERRSTLLRDMPKLIDYLVTSLALDFSSIYRSANEGGLQCIQEVASKFRTFVERERLSVAERIFTLVALLRTAKVLLCVVMGPNLCVAARSYYDDEARSRVLDRDDKVWLI